MAENRSFFIKAVRRPLKIMKNFLKFQVIVTILAVALAFVFPPEPLNAITPNSEELFTEKELSQYNGENGKPLYLALLGSVYDVSRGIKHYGPGCAYNFFVGRDASVAFITGNFDDFDSDSSDVIAQVTGKDLLGLANWKRFYDKDYIYKGKLIGRFYDERGMLTTYHYKFLALVEQAEQTQLETEQLRTLYPDCNIEWSEESGTHVWCTETSGGKQRDWKGYPRKLFEVGNDSFRCACIRKEDLQSNAVMLRNYENCDILAHECYYKVD